MTWLISLLATLLMFLFGLRLSAFFSGSETGFYRLSFLRLSLDAQAGDGVARRLTWFSQNPAHFVATTLVGNNVANYITTLAIGLFTAQLLSAEMTGFVEILATLALSPIVFVFGELIPKNLYYRAPMHLLRRDSRWFGLAFQVLRPCSWPLVAVARLLERMVAGGNEQLETVLGRNRLVQVLSQGHREGLISDVQSRLIHGVLHTASLKVHSTVTPLARVLGLPDTVDKDELLKFARDYGLSNVLIRTAEDDQGWYGYVRVADILDNERRLSSTIRSMPELDARQTRLETLLQLREAGAMFGIVRTEGRTIGIVNEAGLLEQLFRSPHLTAAGTAVNQAGG